MTRMRGEEGQAAVEMIGALPLLVVGVLAVLQVLAAGTAREAATGAAQAGAMALLQGGDPEDAARRAVPGWARGQVRVKVSGREVRVRIAPRTVLPGTGELLAVQSSAHAGPTT